MASSSQWFETIAEAQRRAKRRLPRSVYSALMAGAESGVTLEDNLTAYRELGFFPRIAAGANTPEIGCQVLGQAMSMPVLISPTGVQAVHPDGEVAVARAAASAGIAMGLSSFASKPIEEVIAANEKLFFQMYWLGSRERIEQLLDRARSAGAKAIILTLDWSFAHRRDWGSPAIPETLDLRAMLKLAPEVLVRPRWLRDYARAGGPPDLGVPNMSRPTGSAPSFFEAYGEWMTTPAPTWSDVEWLCAQWEGPVLVKGVSHPDDARAAVQAGAAAVSVSNHGGNNLDGTPAAIRILPGVVEAVGDEIEVLLDGGIRRGSDVVKALALGARAVMIGRAYLWGLAASGEAGVSNVVEILRSGIIETLNAIDRVAIRDLCPDDLVIPSNFTRAPATSRV
jgi:heme/flavin dehydrogenase (mycofactocin system)